MSNVSANESAAALTTHEQSLFCTRADTQYRPLLTSDESTNKVQDDLISRYNIASRHYVQQPFTRHSCKLDNNKTDLKKYTCQDLNWINEVTDALHFSHCLVFC